MVDSGWLSVSGEWLAVSAVVRGGGVVGRAGGQCPTDDAAGNREVRRCIHHHVPTAVCSAQTSRRKLSDKATHRGRPMPVPPLHVLVSFRFQVEPVSTCADLQTCRPAAAVQPRIQDRPHCTDAQHMTSSNFRTLYIPYTEHMQSRWNEDSPNS
jgi:hypothetical protein